MTSTSATMDSRGGRPISGSRLGDFTYILAVAAIASLGIARDSAPTILVAAAMALPASALTLPGYYLAYGLWASVTGASPDRHFAATSCTPTGDCVSVSSGDQAAWFVLTTDVLCVLALTCAAILNVIVLHKLRQRRRLEGASLSD